MEIFTNGTYIVHNVTNKNCRQKDNVTNKNCRQIYYDIRYCFDPLVTVLDLPYIVSRLPSSSPPLTFSSFLKLSSNLLHILTKNWPTVAVIFDLDPESWFGVFVISISATIEESKARVSTGSNSIPPAKVVIGHHRFSGRPPAWPSCSFEVVARFQRYPTRGIRRDMYRTIVEKFWTILVNSFASWCSWRHEKYVLYKIQ